MFVTGKHNLERKDSIRKREEEEIVYLFKEISLPLELSSPPRFRIQGALCNTSIPHGVLSFQIVFVDKFNLMKDIFFWPVSEGLYLISSRYI